MPAKRLNIAAAAYPQQKPSPQAALHAGADGGIHRLKSIANTSEALRLLPPTPDAASWFVADAGAVLPWEHDAALRAVMSRGETLLEQVRYQQEKREATPLSCWRLTSKRALVMGGLMFSSACMVGAWRAYQWLWTSGGFDSDGARPVALCATRVIPPIPLRPLGHIPCTHLSWAQGYIRLPWVQGRIQRMLLPQPLERIHRPLPLRSKTPPQHLPASWPKISTQRLQPPQPLGQFPDRYPAP